jgi:hypothetical protein
MKFSGRLHIDSDPPEWLKTDLTLAQGRVELTSSGEVLGSWSTTQVKAERVDVTASSCIWVTIAPSLRPMMLWPSHMRLCLI